MKLSASLDGISSGKGGKNERLSQQDEFNVILIA